MAKGKPGLDHREVIREFKEDPLQKFRHTFALMSIVPFSIIFYLLLVRLLALFDFVGDVWVIVSLSTIVSLLGFFIGCNVIDGLLRRLMIYASKLKTSNHHKSALVANVSHEVRTPLAAIKLTLSNIADEIMGTINQEQKKAINHCQNAIDRLVRMVTQLLHLSEVEAGMCTMRRSSVDVASLIDNELSKFDAILKNKNLRLRRQLPASSIEIWADSDKIAQVFDNLFNNAVQYTDEGKEIVVRLAIVNNDIRIEIEDNGSGIPADKIDKIFDKYERVTHGKTLGTGLGLPIAKDIVEMHSGKIWAESEAEKGSRFIILLPQDLRGKK